MSNVVKNRLFSRPAVLVLAAFMMAGCQDEDNNLFGNNPLQNDENITDHNDGGSGVGDVAASVAHLSWHAPATRANGSSLAIHNLKEYVIYYGQDPDSLDKTITLNDDNTGRMEHIIDDLTNGEWFFAIRSIDADGRVSALSEVVSKSISI